MYRCATGLIDEKANGCIMADEMGLGKTVSVRHNVSNFRLTDRSSNALL